jgi:hypothetical protein
MKLSSLVILTLIYALFSISCAPWSRESDKESFYMAQYFYDLGEFNKSITSAEKVDHGSKYFDEAIQLIEKSKFEISHPTQTYDVTRCVFPPLEGITGHLENKKHNKPW